MLEFKPKPHTEVCELAHPDRFSVSEFATKHGVTADDVFYCKNKVGLYQVWARVPSTPELIERDRTSWDRDFIERRVVAKQRIENMLAEIGRLADDYGIEP